MPLIGETFQMHHKVFEFPVCGPEMTAGCTNCPDARLTGGRFHVMVQLLSDICCEWQSLALQLKGFKTGEVISPPHTVPDRQVSRGTVVFCLQCVKLRVISCK